MELKQLEAALEAVLFAAAEPVAVPQLAEALAVENTLVEKLLLTLRDIYEKEEHGIQLIQLNNAWQFTTKSIYEREVRRVLDNAKNTPLSAAALEVLAIIAYNQPVSRSFVEQVRGVDSNGIVTSLTQKGLLEEAGRLDLPGKPIAYKTTDVFLRSFGISSLNQLPPLHEEVQPESVQQEISDILQQTEPQTDE